VITDEVLELQSGVGETYLTHDNVRADTLEVWTGPNKTGIKILGYTMRTIEDKPWKTFIRVTAPVDRVYLTYETVGDQVEADDINTVQDAIEALQQQLEQHKADEARHILNSEIDGGSFA
jgi:hypothetical protein